MQSLNIALLWVSYYSKELVSCHWNLKPYIGKEEADWIRRVYTLAVIAGLQVSFSTYHNSPHKTLHTSLAGAYIEISAAAVEGIDIMKNKLKLQK